jgi:hypothetical protein
MKTLQVESCGILRVHPNEVPGSPSCVPARVPLGDPQREGRVCAANFDNAVSMHEYAETMLTIPCAAKFISNVGKAFNGTKCTM